MRTIVELIRATVETQPDHPAIIEESGPRLTYSSLWDRVQERSEAFRQAGVKQADRCGLLCEQGSEFIVAALAILKAGGCLVPIPEDQRGDESSPYLTTIEPHYVIDQAQDFVPRERDQASAIDGAGDEEFRALDPAYIRFTSGTTSDSQGVLLSHQAITERTRAVNRGLRVTPDDRILWILPMVHHFVASILVYLRHGATILLPDGELAQARLEFAREQGCTLLYATPYQHNRLANVPLDSTLEELRLAVSTASGLRLDVAERFRNQFSVPLTQALGIIEAGLPTMNTSSARNHPLSVGQPLPDYEVTLGKEGSEADESSGEILVDGPGLLDAYVNPWQQREEILGQDGFRTGDHGRWDQEGNLHLVGRRANRINLAGMKFYAEEIEGVLNRHESIEVSRVSARSHEEVGEVPVAEVVIASGKERPTENELQNYCRGSLDGYKVPRSVSYVDSISRTDTGKIKRH